MTSRRALLKGALALGATGAHDDGIVVVIDDLVAAGGALRQAAPSTLRGEQDARGSVRDAGLRSSSSERAQGRRAHPPMVAWYQAAGGRHSSVSSAAAYAGQGAAILSRPRTCEKSLAPCGRTRRAAARSCGSTREHLGRSASGRGRGVIPSWRGGGLRACVGRPEARVGGDRRAQSTAA